jgi:hypothetical protein
MHPVGRTRVHLLTYLHNAQQLEERYTLVKTQVLIYRLIALPFRLLISLSVVTQRGSQTYRQISILLLILYLLCPHFRGNMLHQVDRVAECRQAEEGG